MSFARFASSISHMQTALPSVLRRPYLVSVSSLIPAFPWGVAVASAVLPHHCENYLDASRVKGKKAEGTGWEWDPAGP